MRGFLVLILVILVPFILIWSLNTLFALGLAYNGINWLAAAVLMLALK